MGLEEPEQAVFALAFDTTVLQRARRWESERLEESRRGEKPVAERTRRNAEITARAIAQLPEGSPLRKRLEEMSGG
jgi:hypothetical protein